MKSKSIIIFISLLLFGLAFWYFKYVYGWMEFRKNSDTPKEYLSRNIIESKNYSKDSTEILLNLRIMLRNHEQTFYIKDYFDSTELIIDSILYSANFEKMAVLVITKNPTYRQLIPRKEYTWYYDGYCYLGIKKDDTIDLASLTEAISNYYNKDECSNVLRDLYFKDFASNTSLDEVSKRNYNLNDVRFWDCPIWNGIAERKRKEREFEEMKKRHPENVYEP